MDSPEKELTSLVPSSVFARNRKSSRHSYAEEPVVRGPINSAVIDLSTSPTQSQKRLSFDEEHSVQRETSPTEEELEVLRRKGLAAARDKRVHGNGKGKQPVYETEVVEEESDDEGQDLCVICLQAVRDPTIVGECGHKIFCFECINVWANQSRQCPLCVRSMSPFLLHELDSPVGPTKFYLPPLPTIRPNPVSQTPFPSSSSSAIHRYQRHYHHSLRHDGTRELVYSHRDGLRGRGEDLWARVKQDKQGLNEEDVLERAIARRKEIYRFGLYAKHIASNTFTRFKPSPTPCQFAADKEMIARATSFIRRELRVWPHLDVEFLTTYIISLMKSIDIRSEPAVRLLADFLDERGSQGRDRRGAEHFAHEVYSFLRSPYRDLALYDAIAQYDKPSWEPEQSVDSESDGDDASAQRPSPGNASRGGVIDVDARSPLRSRRSPARSRARPRSPSVHSVASDASSVSSIERRQKRVKRSGRRWNEADSYIAPRSPNIKAGRNWNRRDSWVNSGPPLEVKRKESIAPPRASDSGVELQSKQPSPKRSVVILDRPAAVHRGMRGWGETLEVDVDQPETGATQASVPQPRTLEASPGTGHQTAQPEARQIPSLELRIFGIAPRTTPREQNDVGLVSASISKVSYDTDDEERALTDAIWAPERTSMDPADVSSVSKAPAAQSSAGSQAQNIIKEKLQAKLVKEKMQSSNTIVQSARSALTADSGTKPAFDTLSLESQAKAKARLALKLRLEKEKAIAQARAKDIVTAPTEAGERAAALRAKLLEKKLANSQAVK